MTVLAKLPIPDIFANVGSTAAAFVSSEVLGGEPDLVASTFNLQHVGVLSGLWTFLSGLAQNIYGMAFPRPGYKLRPGMSLTDALGYFAPLVVTWVMAAWLFREERDGPTTRMLMILLATFANLSILLLIISEMTKTRYPAAWIVASGVPLLALPALAMRSHPWVLPLCIAIGILRFAGLWLNFQKAIVHYCGMRCGFLCCHTVRVILLSVCTQIAFSGSLSLSLPPRPPVRPSTAARWQCKRGQRKSQTRIG